MIDHDPWKVFLESQAMKSDDGNGKVWAVIAVVLFAYWIISAQYQRCTVIQCDGLMGGLCYCEEDQR